MTLSGTITASALHTDFDAKRTDLNTSAQTSALGWIVDVRALTLLSGDDVSLRSRDFVARDDYELRALRLSVFGHHTATVNTTATLQAIDSDGNAITAAVGEKTVAVTVETDSGDAGAEVTGAANYDPSTGEKHFLLKGFTYRLVLSTDDASNAVDRARAVAVLASRRRRR